MYNQIKINKNYLDIKNINQFTEDEWKFLYEYIDTIKFGKENMI